MQNVAMEEISCFGYAIRLLFERAIFSFLQVLAMAILTTTADKFNIIYNLGDVCIFMHGHNLETNVKKDS